MAYAALASLAKTINLILKYHQDSISTQLEHQIRSIHKSVNFLQGFLEDSPEEAYWVEERITEVIHKAEDIIEFLLSQQASGSSVGTSISKFEQRPSGEYEHPRYDFPELEKIAKRIESIIEDLTGKQQGFAIGFDDDLVEIKSRLCGESFKIEVISIVGMGGVGKTTLARNAYDDPYIAENFEIRAWVTLSQNYSLQEIISSLLVSMGVLEAKYESLTAIDVYKKLKGRRYLVVLDDMWSVEAWDDLKMMFPDDGNGSRIMLTTRLGELARYACPCGHIHHMSLMDEDQSWHLLRQKVFEQETCPAELEDIGKMIATSCRGLPLAIVLISGLLSDVDRTKAAWERIAEDVKSAIYANDKRLYEILSLSYTLLPLHLRPCFLYFGCLPVDYEMRVSKLIKLWVAEGFLEPNKWKSFEETAEEYLEDLVKRNLVSITKRNSNGRIKCVSVHDLLRDLCIRIAQEENFCLQVHQFLQGGMPNPRRLSIFTSDLRFLENVSISRIRTIICWEHILERPFGYFRLLRILDISNDDNLSLPVDIFDPFCIRYLACNCSSSIPAAISNLRNLQTLIINSTNNYHHVVELPVEIWSMLQLRHLVVLYCVLPSEEGATFSLQNLQTLSNAVNLICSEEILKMIPNLKKLRISYAEGGNYEENYQLHNLIHLQLLEDLKIEMSNPPRKQLRVCPAFPWSLKKLTLSGLGLPWEDLRIVGSLPNLKVLKLRDGAYIGSTWETIEDEFCRLNFLEIKNTNLVYWITESSHFPSLKCLVIHRCMHLMEIPLDIGDIPTLERIEVDNLNESLVLSVEQIQREQQDNGNDDIQVRFIR